MGLHEVGLKYRTDKATLHNFCNEYEQFISNKKISTIIEVGILKGESLRMWSEFYPEATIIGLDINPKSLINEGKIQSFLADQNDVVGTILPIVQKYNCSEILFIDDGSHMWSHQIMTHTHVWNILQSGAMYIMEDLHTSLYPKGYPHVAATFEDYHTSALDYINEFVRTSTVKRHKLIDPRKTISLSMIMEKS